MHRCQYHMTVTTLLMTPLHLLAQNIKIKVQHYIFGYATPLMPALAICVVRVKHQSLQVHHKFAKKKFSQTALSRQSNPPEVKIISMGPFKTIAPFQSETSPFKITIPSQNKNFQNQSFQDHHTNSKICFRRPEQLMCTLPQCHQ